MARTSYGFFAAPGTDYRSGSEPELARRLDRLARALRLHLIGISGARSPQHSLEVGGFADDPHTRGQASDTPGVEGVSESTLRRYGLTRPFLGSSEADHIQLLGGARGTGAPVRGKHGDTLADYWTQGGGSSRLSPIMAAIGMAESGGRIDAIGGPNTDGSYDYGWLQINSSHGYDKAKLLSDPVYTARAGVAIERSQGLGAWTTYTSGAYRQYLGGRNVPAKPGRTRPGGNAPDDGGGGVETIFADFLSEGEKLTGLGGMFGLPGLVLPSFNPLDFFSGASGAVKDTAGFLKWIAWIFHPKNVLRIVEFVTGLTIMGAGLHVAIQAYHGGDNPLARAERKVTGAATTAASVTPVGRAATVAKGARAGKTAARASASREEYTRAHRSAKTKESARQKTKRNEAEMNRRFGGVPF